MAYKNNIVGIYQIVNTINGKSYIGSSLSCNRRKSYHKCDGKQNKAVNKRFRAAIKCYGYDSFEFKILEIIGLEVTGFLDRADLDILLNEREQYWVDTLNPEYNIKKADVSRPSKGEIVQSFSTPTSKRIAVFNKDEEFIEICPSLQYAYRKYKSQPWHIRKIADGKSCGPSKFGYLFKWENNINEPFKFTSVTVNKDKRLTYKAVYQYDKDKQLLNRFNSHHIACKELNITGDRLRNLLKGKTMHEDNKQYLNNFLFTNNEL